MMREAQEAIIQRESWRMRAESLTNSPEGW